LGVGDRFFDHGDYFVVIVCFGESKAHERLAQAHEMRVTFDKSRHNCLAFQVDHFGVPAGERVYFIVGPDRNYSIACDRDRFGVGLILIDCDDIPVDQHPLGGLGANGYGRH
jgi:hypothetical protein